MTEIKRHVYVNFDEFKKAADKVVELIKASPVLYDGICAIPRGGLILGVYLSYRLDLPLVNSITERTLIVDQICCEGKTLEKYNNNDKVVLVAKTSGAIRVDDLLWCFNVPDDTRVIFWWEEDLQKKTKKKRRN